jgi:hypothetical protein
MPFIRAICASIVAVTVALAPVTSGLAALSLDAAPHAPSQPVAHHHDHAVAHEHAAQAPVDEMAATDCCPNDSAGPAPKPTHDCGDMSGCALCHISLTPTLGTLSHPLENATALSWQMSQAVPPVASSPPFRPPRS